MATSFVHVGDTHLQSTHPRNDVRLKALDQIVNEGLRIEGLGAWIYPGDLFHARSTIEDRNAMAARLVRMANAAPVLVCPGNHDLPGDLDIFAKLKAKWPVIVQSLPGVIAVPLATGDTAAVAVLPYPTKGGLVARGVDHQEIVPTAEQLLDVMFMQFASEMATFVARGAIPLFMGHVNVAGSMSSNGQPQIGMEIELDRAMFQRLPTIYNALNHIHLAQEVGGGHYAGSICRLSWGETEPKSYSVLHCTRFAAGWTGFAERMPIDVAPMYHVEGQLTRDAFTYQVIGDHGPLDGAAISWKGCEVRVRYRFNASEKSGLSQARVLAEFADALRLEVEPIAVPDRELRQPEVAAARTLSEKLAAYMHVEQLPASLAEKLAALEHGDPLVTIGNVERALAVLGQPREESTVAA